MAIQFRNAPLIEVIAELRWGPTFPPLLAAPGQQFTLDADMSQNEEFFMHFGAECSLKGLQRAERIVPPGFPVLPGQVVYRFRSGDRNVHNLLQVGPGVFTANALPPYEWDTFERFLTEGIDTLLSARPKKEFEEQFATVNLRFVNGFDDAFTKGKSRIQFLEELGFRLGTPRGLQDIVQGSSEAGFNMNYTALLQDGARINVNLGEGAKEGQPIQVLELGFTHSNISSDKGELVAVLNKCHSLIEKIFLDITEKFHPIMLPGFSK